MLYLLAYILGGILWIDKVCNIVRREKDIQIWTIQKELDGLVIKM